MRKTQRRAVGRAFELLCILLVISMLLCAIPMTAAEEATDGADKKDTVTIVVAAKDIPQGVRITDKYLTTAEVVNVNIPSNVVTDTEELLSRYTEMAIAEGEYIYRAQTSADPVQKINETVLVREVAESRSNFVNVTDYVKPNTGLEVDYYLQQIIDLNPNRTIYFPKGEYILGSPISTPAKADVSVSLVLDDGAVLKASESWKAVDTMNALVCLGGRVPKNDVYSVGSYYSIRGGVLDANNECDGLSIDSGRESVIRSLCIVNAKTGIDVKKGANNVSSDCDFEDVVIIGNNKMNSIGMDITGYDNTFTNIKIYNMNTGITGIGAGNFFKSIHVINTEPEKNYIGTVAFAGNGNNWYSGCYVENMNTAYQLGSTGLIWDSVAVWNNDACLKQTAIQTNARVPLFGIRVMFHEVEGAETTFITTANADRKTIMGCIFDPDKVTNENYKNIIKTDIVWAN